MTKALHALAGLGDVYTDAPECAASVAAAQNLAALAQLLPPESDIAMSALLTANNAVVCTAMVSADGTVLPNCPLERLPTEGPWALCCEDGFRCAVERFPDESFEDTKWVVSDARAFYTYLLR